MAPASRTRTRSETESGSSMAAGRLLAQSPAATLADIGSRGRGLALDHLPPLRRPRGLIVAVAARTARRRQRTVEDLASARRTSAGMARCRLMPIHVSRRGARPSVLPEQLVAEAQRIANVPLALYVLDIDGSHLLRVAGPERLPRAIEAPLAIGPELDPRGLANCCRASSSRHRGTSRSCRCGCAGARSAVLLTPGASPARPLTELARQAAAAVTLADRYTDAFARRPAAQAPEGRRRDPAERAPAAYLPRSPAAR